VSDQLDLFAAAAGNRLGAFHRDGPDTERTAAIDNYVRSGTQRAAVLGVLTAAGERGATDYEVYVALRGRPGHVARPHVAGCRRLELQEHGLVARTDRTRPTDTGSAAIVWQTTELGRTVNDALERRA
jgi:hypothetical protein